MCVVERSVDAEGKTNDLGAAAGPADCEALVDDALQHRAVHSHAKSRRTISIEEGFHKRIGRQTPKTRHKARRHATYHGDEPKLQQLPTHTIRHKLSVLIDRSVQFIEGAHL